MTPSLALWLLRWAQANTETLFCQITAEWLSIRNVKITYTRLYILRNNWVLFMYHYAHSNLMVIIMRECLTTLSVMNLFLTSSRTILRCIFIPFPQILSLTTEEISLPLHFSSWGSCTLQLSSLSLLSKLNKPSDFSCSSQVLLSRSFAIFVVFWMLSNSFMSFLYCSAPNCAQCWNWGCSSAGWSERIPSSDQLAVLGLINPRVWLTFLQPGTLLIHMRLVTNQSPQSLFAGQISSCSSPCLHLYTDLTHSRCRIQDLLLLNFMQSVIVHPSKLSRPLCHSC